jgi:MFS family permease
VTDGRTSWVPPIGRNAWLFLAMNALSCLGSGLTMPFLIVYLHAVRGLSLPTAGFVLAAIGVVGVIVTPLTGPLVDRIGSMRAFMLGLFVGGLGIAAFTLATTAPRALAAAIVYGTASGLMWGGFTTLLTELVPAAERGAVFALRYTTANVAFGAGALITGFVTVGETPGPYIAILLADALSYVLFAGALRPLRSTLITHTATRDTGSYGPVLRDRALLGALLVNSLLMVFALAQTSTTFAAWVTGPGGGDARIVGLAFVANIAVLVLVQLLAIRLARGRSRLGGAARAALFFAAAWIVLVLPATLGLDGVVRAVLTVGSLAIFALGEATLAPTLPALINDLAPDDLRGRYNAIFSLSNQIGPILAPAMAGLALGHGLGRPYLWGLALVCVITSGLALRLRRVTPVAADRGV